VNQALLLERRAIRDPQTPPDLVGLRRLVKESKRLSALVIELLDASRLEEGGLVSDGVPTELVEMAREIIERRSDARHAVDLDGDAEVVAEIDRARIAQLLENLLENAIKYSPAGGEIGITVTREGDQARIVVRDGGIGIPAADLPHVFERFHRGTNVDDRRFAGMGLGLYICRGIALQHGGSISVESVVGRGSTFTVALPLRSSVAGGHD